ARDASFCHMKRWHKQVVKNTVKGVVPGRQYLRRLWRRFSPHETHTVKNNTAFENAIRQIGLLRDADFSTSGLCVLELGSGWYPILPLVYLVAGARQVILTDIDRLLDVR